MISDFIKEFLFCANVPDDLPPPAFGAKGCAAADVPKMPKAWWLGSSVCSLYIAQL